MSPFQQPDKRVHILQVVHSLDIGGTERVVCDLALRFNDGEFRTSVCCLDELGAFGEDLRRDGIAVHVLGRKPGLDIAVTAHLRDLYRREKVDLIHAHQYTPYFYAAGAALRAGLRPVIFTEHGRHWPDQLRVKRAMANQILSLTTAAYTAVSEFSRRSLMQFEKMPGRKIQVVYNGIAVGDFHYGTDDRQRLRREAGLEDEDLLALSVGRMDPIKDFATLIGAFAAVARRAPRAFLWIAGDGDETYMRRLQAQVLEQGLVDRVKLLGVRRDVGALLAACDLYALPSITEAMSMTILEAMAAERAVMATRTGGNPELVADDETGVLVPVGDATAMGDALERLLANGALRQRMGAAGRARVEERFSKEQCFSAYRNLYRSLSNKSKRLGTFTTEAQRTRSENSW